MIDRTHLTKKQVTFLDMVDAEIAIGLDDINNGRTHTIQEVKQRFRSKSEKNRLALNEQKIGAIV